MIAFNPIDWLLLFALVTAVCTDLYRGKIYNLLVYPSMVIALVALTIKGGLGGLAAGVVGLAAGLLLLMIPFVLGGMGAGDVKLLALVGAFKGPYFVFNAFLASAIAGGAIALVLLLQRKELGLFFKKILFVLKSMLYRIPSGKVFTTLDEARPGESFPYALAIFIGVLAVYLAGEGIV
ncbi:MAG TPA: prepilin peptidase [Clostridia bacterium]|nr:prepilin peptidase [Clostridia bacterium]